jgi:hypothetical protein
VLALAGAGLIGTLVFAVQFQAPEIVSNHVAGVMLVEDVSAASVPTISQAQATQTALAKLLEMNPAIGGYKVTSAHHAAALFSTTDEVGRQLLSLHSPIDAWVIQVRAPDQGGHTQITGYVVVSSATGVVKAASLGTAS